MTDHRPTSRPCRQARHGRATGRSPSRPWGRSRGLTLVELLLALSVTAMIGAGVAAMMLLVSSGTTERTDLRALLVKEKSVAARLSAAVRSSLRVLDQGSDYVVLWIGDTRRDDQPNLSEIRLIERLSDGRLLCYSASFPDGWTDEQIATADTAYQLTDNFRTVTTALKSGSYFPSELWAQGVQSWTVVLDATPETARLLSYRMAMRAGDGSSTRQPLDTLIGAIALRNH